MGLAMAAPSYSGPQLWRTLTLFMCLISCATYLHS